MVTPEKSKLYTVDEFEAFIALPENNERLFELIGGEIVEKVPTLEHGVVSVTSLGRYETSPANAASGGSRRKFVIASPETNTTIASPTSLTMPTGASR